MRATDIVRRIDDLGRIVIPREIRRNLCIKEGDSIEFYVDKDYIILKKFSEQTPLETLADFMSNFGNDIPADAQNLITAAINIIKNENK